MSEADSMQTYEIKAPALGRYWTVEAGDEREAVDIISARHPALRGQPLHAERTTAREDDIAWREILPAMIDGGKLVAHPALQRAVLIGAVNYDRLRFRTLGMTRVRELLAAGILVQIDDVTLSLSPSAIQ